MHTPSLILYLCFILLVTGCAVNPPVSGPQALAHKPDQPAQTGATNADRRPVDDLTNSF